MELKPEWGKKMPQTPPNVREEINEQMGDTADWREKKGKSSLVGKTQEEAEEEMLGEDLRVSEYMDTHPVMAFGLPNAEELVRIGLRVLPEKSVKTFLETAREYLTAARYGNEEEMVGALKRLRDVESSITAANRKKFPTLSSDFQSAIAELVGAAQKMKKPEAGWKKRAA